MIARRYPKAGPVAGALIRKVLQFLKEQEFGLPISSDILVAVSGGADSMALAHLLVHFGRKIAPRSQVGMLHINHGWRAHVSDQDALFVERHAKKWKVPFYGFELPPPQAHENSLEEKARTARSKIFEQSALDKKALILTAHQADDVAETLLWRLLTGAASTHGGGILFRKGAEIRPLLNVRKQTLIAYLQEVNQPWREDSTNQDARFLRARMRKTLLPEVERLFPKGIDHLVAASLRAQNKNQADDLDSAQSPTILFSAAGIKVRREHWQKVLQFTSDPSWQGELHLANGWKLKRRLNSEQTAESWVLERGQIKGKEFA